MNFWNFSRKLHLGKLLKVVEGNISYTKGSRNALVNLDTISQDIKAAASTRQLLDLVSMYLPQYKSDHIMQTLRALFNLQKQGSDQNFLNNDNFISLCKKLKQECRSMDINESIDALKILSYMGVPGDSLIIQSLLHLIKHSVNALSLQQVIFIDFLLRKFKEPTALMEALLIALPLVFQLQIQRVIDHENIEELVEYLQYASKCSLPTNYIQNIISALTLHGQDLPLFAAKSVVWSLSNLEHFEKSYERLLYNAMNVLKKDIMLLTIEDVDVILTKMLSKVKQDVLIFYDDELLDKVANYVVDKKVSFVETMWILKKITKMGHINISILDYLDELISENPELLSKCRPSSYFTFINALSTADYKTKHWNIIKQSILDNDIIMTGKNALPWSKCSVELASLDIYNDVLLERIFSPRFLKSYLSREFNILDHFQLLLIHQAVKTMHTSYTGPFLSPDVIEHAITLYKTPFEVMPIKSALVHALENEKYVAHGVNSRLGHYIDYVVVMCNGQPVAITSAVDRDTMYIEDIVVPENSTTICILVLPTTCYATNCNRLKGVMGLKIRTLEALGYKVLPLPIQLWKNLDDKEKIPYLLQEINLLCK